MEEFQYNEDDLQVLPQDSTLRNSKPYNKKTIKVFIITIIINVLPKAGPSMQTLARRLQFWPKAGLPLQTREPSCSFTRDE